MNLKATICRLHPQRRARYRDAKNLPRLRSPSTLREFLPQADFPVMHSTRRWITAILQKDPFMGLIALTLCPKSASYCLGAGSKPSKEGENRSGTVHSAWELQTT